MTYTWSKYGNEFVFHCENCDRTFKAYLPVGIARKIKTDKDLKVSYFIDEPDHPLYNIRYLIKYGVCWKCKKDPKLMKLEAEQRRRDARERSRERFQRWMDSMD